MEIKVKQRLVFGAGYKAVSESTWLKLRRLPLWTPDIGLSIFVDWMSLVMSLGVLVNFVNDHTTTNIKVIHEWL